MPNGEGEDDPIYGAGKGRQGKLRVVSDSPFLLRQARLPLPDTIPPRQWLYGTQLLRGFVTVLVAPGGTGKSLLAMGICVAVASGRQLFNQRIYEQTNASYVNLEDPEEELERRLAALQIHHQVGTDKLRGRLFLNSGDERGLTIATVSDDGTDIVYPDVEAVIHEINEHNIGLTAVDPFAESHDLEENSNPQMIRASKAWRTVARATNCAILLVHHVRKGIAADIDAARGAKALTDSARVGLLMSPMSDKEADELGIDPEDRGALVRLDNAKSNMAPRAAKADWFQMASVPLGNSSRVHPNGDQVAALVVWNPPSVLGDLTVAQINEALDAIEKGPREGVRYSPTRRGRANTRWAGQVLIDLFDVNMARAGAIIGAWLSSGLLVEKTYHDAETRKDRLGLSVNATKRPGIRA
jgi:hypothetical protein